MRTLLLGGFSLFIFVACSSSDGGSGDNVGGRVSGGGAGSSAGGGGAGGSSGASNAAGTAQLRFVYQADWAAHLGTCAAISDYRIKFAANPVPVTATIDLTPGSVSAYVSVDGRDYADADVLHIFTCSKSQTSKQTLQLFGKFGTDLSLVAQHKYTVTLAGSTATLAEDP